MSIVIHGTRIVEFGLGTVCIVKSRIESFTNYEIVRGLVLGEVKTPRPVGHMCEDTKDIDFYTDKEQVVLAFHNVEGAKALRDSLDEIIASF